MIKKRPDLTSESAIGENKLSKQYDKQDIWKILVIPICNAIEKLEEDQETHQKGSFFQMGFAATVDVVRVHLLEINKTSIRVQLIPEFNMQKFDDRKKLVMWMYKYFRYTRDSNEVVLTNESELVESFDKLDVTLL